MKTKSLAGMLLSICLVLVFGVGLAAGSSEGGHAPVRPTGADGDGYADLAIGIPYRDIIDGDDTFLGAGIVGVVYGTDGGLNYAGGETYNRVNDDLYPPASANDHFGQALAAGDFNRDGYLDLAIGLPDQDWTTGDNSGAVDILFGDDGGFNNDETGFVFQESLGSNISETNDRFGAALAAGDFNGDGCDDLAIGAPGQDFLSTVESTGAVFIAYGGPEGPGHEGWQVIYQGIGIQENPEETDNFGSVLAAGDFDGDRIHDLAIGVPNEDILVGATTYVDAGVVQVMYGSKSGLASDGNDLLYQGHDGLQDDLTNYDRFGAALAAGNFDGGRYDDLAIGVPFEHRLSIDDGIVQIVWGDVGGLTTDIDLRLW